MRFLIGDDIFCDSGQWSDLEALLHHARRKRCYIDAQDSAAVSVSPWFSGLDRARKRDWESASDWSTRDSTLFRLRSVLIGTTSSAQMSLADALSLAEQPVRVWVENDRNDRTFWLSMMEEDQRATFVALESNNVASFESRGGLNELRSSLEQRVKRGALSSGDWVLFDSDGDGPGERSSEAKAMVAFCLANRLPHHCLSRRAIENYLPRAALWGWAASDSKRRAERRSRVQAYQDMSNDQRNHYPLKSGWARLPSQTATALYANLSPRSRLALSHGISPNIASLYSEYFDAIRGWSLKEGIDAGVQQTITDLLDWVRVPYA